MYIYSQSLGFVSGLVSGWKLRLALGSCSGLRLAPCLCVLYFLEVLCLGLCLGFYVWACVSFTPWSLCLGLCLGGSRGLHLAHARLMLGASESFPVFVFLCTFLRFYVWACVWGFMSGLCFFVLLGFVSGLVSGWKLRLALGSCSAHARAFGYSPRLCVSLYLLEFLLFTSFKRQHAQETCQIPFPFPPVNPWGLCLGLCLGGSCGLHLAHARLMLGASACSLSLCFFVLS
jgi:hypothetical protein